MNRNLKQRLGFLTAAILATVLAVADLNANIQKCYATRDIYDAAGRLTRSYTPRPASSPYNVPMAENPSGDAVPYSVITYSRSGNIGSIVWNGNDKVNRRYNFTYDGLGRLIAAAYSSPKEPLASFFPNAQPDYSTSYTYGLDSRPLTVQRKGVRVIRDSGDLVIPYFGEIDNLTFTYAGSRLKKIYDAADDVIYAGATDFNDGADSDTEYTYDVDGRMISDANKGITSIKYNAIGLPAEVTFSDGSAITNRYGADGTLLQRVQKEPSSFSLMDLSVVGQIISQTIDNHIGVLTFKTRGLKTTKPSSIKFALSRIDTPNGFMSSGRMHYYIKDYQGNVRQVTDAEGTVEQDNHYYPYGMLMGESSNILASARGYKSVSFNPYLYGSKEYLTTASANLLDFSARTYDPAAILFQTQDPKASDYTPLNAYLYCGGDPINRIDPTGCSTEVILQEDGRYKIHGGNLEDDDLNIYVVAEKDGKYVRTGEILGMTPTITSFYNSDANGGKGAWATDSYIDTKDNSGKEFISKMTGDHTPGVVEYAIGARNGHSFDFKTTNGTSEKIKGIDIYRGMRMGTAENGMTIYSSARDIGNIMAGYVVGVHGWSWAEARIAFDAYQSYTASKFLKLNLQLVSEGISSQYAQIYGINWGRRDTPIYRQILNRATQFRPSRIASSLIDYYFFR